MNKNEENNPRPTKVALIQHCATADVNRNMETLATLVAQAATQGAEFIALPEAFAFIGPDKQKRQILEPLSEDADQPTPILDQCRALAQQHQCELLLGGFHERVSAEPPAANTSVHILANGEISALYRKIHMFDIDLADGTRLFESRATQAGSHAVTTQCAFGTLGLSICYDLRFPALYGRLVNMGAIAISVPSAFTKTTGAAHWHALLRARAIETQCYVLAPAQHGRHSEKRQSYGHSLLIDPWGTVLAEGPAAEDAVLIGVVDPNKVAEVRAQMPVAQHHRPFD